MGLEQKWEKCAASFTAYLMAKIRCAGLARAGDLASVAGEVLLPYRGRFVSIADLVGHARRQCRNVAVYEAWCWELGDRLADVSASFHPLVVEALRCHAAVHADLDVTWDQVQEALALADCHPM